MNERLPDTESEQFCLVALRARSNPAVSGPFRMEFVLIPKVNDKLKKEILKFLLSDHNVPYRIRNGTENLQRELNSHAVAMSRNRH